MLPDRNSLLRLLHEIDACLERLLTMTSARGGHESGFADRDRSMPVDERHRNDIVLSDNVGGDVAQGRLRPWMRLVRQRDHGPLVIVVTNVTGEDNRRPGRRVRHGATQHLDVDRLRAYGNHADFRLSLGH